MRIVYISSAQIPSRTANNINIMQMCQAFARMGHEVTLLVPVKSNGGRGRKTDLYDFYGVERSFDIVELPLFSTRCLRFLFCLAAGLKAKTVSPDLVYGRHFLSCFVCAYLKIPVVFEAHQPIAGLGKTAEKLFSILISKDYFQRLVVISEKLKADFLDKYDLKKEKILVAHDAAAIRPDSANVNVSGVSDSGRMQVGYIGQLYSGKGMEIIAELVKIAPWADFHIVGGNEEDIQRWKKELVNCDNVTFYGFVEPGQIENYYFSYDVFLAPYQKRVSASGGGNIASWMSPLKIFEYMAAGKPIICSDLPVLREVLADEKNALLCAPDDPASWLKSLKRLEEDKELGRRISAKAKDDVFNYHTWDMRTQKVLSGIF